MQTTSAVADRPSEAAPAAGPPAWRPGWAEVLVAVAGFAALCVAVLSRAPQLLEPDDYAYRASIIALTHGHLILSDADYQSLLQQLSSGNSPGIMQWVQLASGGWISEKNPGYPFLAAPFQALGVLRLAPLFYGALGAAGLFVGARRWLGRWGGTWAVLLFVSSGAALVFAWRATMSTFTDASLIAAGAGVLLWAMLAVETTVRRRTVVGLLGFVALEAAVFVRYTDVVILGVAVLAVLLTFRRAGLPRRTVAWWLGSVGVFSAGLLAFNQLVYGSALGTGYSSGLVTFSPGAVVPNLQNLPLPLVASMPMLLLALAALGWLAVRAVRGNRPGVDAAQRTRANRDAVVGAVLAAGWLGIWGLYLAYAWTVQAASGPDGSVHVIRFYLPAIGLIALLGAWFLMQLPRWLPPVLPAVVIALGAWSYTTLADSGAGGPGGGPGGGTGGTPSGGQGGPPGDSQPGGPPPGGDAPLGPPPGSGPGG